MDKQAVKSEIQQYLTGQDKVLFAYIFGSFVNKEKYRDIDIVVYTQPEIKLFERGTLQAGLTKFLEEKVDFILLNLLENKNPAFAYKVMTQGELIINSDPEKHTEFKKNTFLYYFDTEQLRNDIEKAFSKRLEANKFGHRNYE